MTSTVSAIAQSEETRSISGFNSIDLKDPFEVHVKIDGTESLKIDASADIIKLIRTTVKDGKLEIKYKDDLKPGEGNSDGYINIYVSAKALSSIVNEGTGSIKVDGNITGKTVIMMLSGAGGIESSVKSDDLNVTITGAGSIILNGTANNAKIIIGGPGDLKGHDLQVENAMVTINGAGSAHIKARKTISGDVNGTGEIFDSVNAITESQIGGSGKINKEN